MSLRRLSALFALCLAVLPAGRANARTTAEATDPPNVELTAQFAADFANLPPVVRHFEGVTETEVADRQSGEKYFQDLVREKVSQRWFAALVSTQPGQRFQITERFATAQAFLEFVQARHAVVEVSAYDEAAAAGGKGRRISAAELAALKRELLEPPLLVSLVFPDTATGRLRDERVEFGFHAAAQVFAMAQSYERHRQLQLAAHVLLRARDEHGDFSAQAQWDALQAEIAAQRFTPDEMPERPLIAANLFVAVEFAVDEFGNFTRFVRAYRESEIQRRIVRDANGRPAQVLALPRGGGQVALASAFRVNETGDALDPVPNPVTGQDVVQLRIENAAERDRRRWSALEFGEPEVLQAAGLAKFGLISAHLEGQRKQLALRRTRLDLFAEPVFAGLSIGGGISGVGFPIGEAARLLYNVTVGPHFLPEVPTVKELRELFLLLVAKDKHPTLRTKPEEFLTAADVRELRAVMKTITDAEAEAYLARVTDIDLNAMQKLARWQNIDAKYTLLANILIGAAKVSGASESGWMKALLNNSIVSINGDLSVKTVLALMLDRRVATPLSGISLKQLVDGDNVPAAAWLQFLDVTVDLRTVANTVARLTADNDRDREMRKPFPYAPRADELAAYEIRIFGYPLLMYYKRGLLKDDIAAFEHDYAYGIVGTHIVEHFATKESLVAELHAGRLTPLGFVRVGDGHGQTVDSRLVVFAHRVSAGKYQGQTAIILYALKAFSDHAFELERERGRFEQYERALAQGGVIEQVIRAGAPEELSWDDFAPVIRTDSEASGDFAALLGGLRELERERQLQEWGAPVPPDEQQRLATIHAELARLGIRTDNPNDRPLLGADRFSSSLRYKKYVNGHWREVQRTLIPSPAEIDREVKKAELANRIESLRQHAVSPAGEGIVLLNEIREGDGRREIGPLVQDGSGQIFGTGVRAGSPALGELFAQLSRSPITNQARLLLNNFAATPVELELAPGEKRTVFLTVEFPLDRDLQTELVHPLSGEPEINRFRNGRHTGLVTDRRIVELSYDDAGDETQSAVYLNRGTRQQPVKGPRLEETRTVEAWFRQAHATTIDPREPRIAKLHLNHVTGQATRETYGWFPQPIEVSDELYVTRIDFDAFGLLATAKVLENGVGESDFQRAAPERVLRPVPGRERFQLVTKTANTPGALADLKARGFQLEVERTDSVKRLSTTAVLDLTRLGRPAAARWTDAWAATNLFTSETRFEYRDDFAFGVMPWRAVTRGAATGAILTEVETTAYDPLTRQLTGTETDYTGRRSQKVWDARWQNPVRVESALRTASYSFNRDETETAGTTQTRDGGEELSRFAGRFDPASGTWQFARTNFFRPGIARGVETEARSGFGRLIAVAAGGEFETRPRYDTDGRELATDRRRFEPATGQFDELLRTEDDYRWRDGARDARVQTFVNGQPHDTFRAHTDSEGRTVSDAVKQFPGLELETTVAFDGATDRPLRSELRQNGAVRLTRQYLPAAQATNGSWLLPSKAVPHWGLTSTQYVRLDDPLARPQTTQLESGERVEVREWFAGTAVAKVAERLDRRGQATERFATEVRGGAEHGVPYDWLRRYKISFWGGAGLAEEKAVVRGSEIALFKSTSDEKTYFDLSRPFDAPLYALDPLGREGVTVTVNGQRLPHALMLYRASLLNWPPAPVGATSPEPLLQLHRVDLRGLFLHQFSTLQQDRAGNLLAELAGKIPNPGPGGYVDSTLFDLLAQARVSRRFRYDYETGWLTEQPDPQTGRHLLAFSEHALLPGATGHALNDSTWREAVTRIVGEQADAREELFATNRAPYIFRRTLNRRERELNPHLPDQMDAWTDWTTTELAADGASLFETETSFDAQGRARVAQAHKVNSSGAPGTKTAYAIAEPRPGVLTEHRLGAGPTTLRLELAGRTNLSGSDFVYLYVNNPDRVAFHFVARDTAGHEVKIYRRDAEDRPGGFLTWAIESANVRWLPDGVVPVQGALVTAPAALADTGRALVLSVHDLAQGGLDLRRIASLEVQANGRAGSGLGLSPVFHLVRGGPFVRDAESYKYSYATENHASGLQTFTKTRKQRTDAETLAGLFQNSVTELNGRTVALGYTRARSAYFPVTVVMDNSDPDAPTALYAMLSTDGRFLEYYRTIKRGDAQVYSVVSGFEIPRVDVTRAAVLDDELTPGYVAYGNNYLVRGNLAKGRGWLSSGLANFQNRITANAFKFGADQWLRDGAAADPLETHFSQLHSAAGQAADINALPLLAQALLSQREVPWKNRNPTPVEDWAQDRTALKARLLNLHRIHKTGLLPTAAETKTELFVDTIEEADLIQLALALKEPGVARDLLNFYWERSHGGTELVHASYHAESGAALRKDPHAKRAQLAAPTAGAQLAIAEAAIRFGIEVPEHDQEFTLGKNLTALVLAKFWQPRGGITETEWRPRTNLAGIALWPEPERFNLRSNARAYLLFRNLTNIMGRYTASGAWALDVHDAVQQQQAWLLTNVVPEVQRTGVVPKGLFQLQDIYDQTTAPAVERWTAAEDWLAFLEAADALGLPRAQTHRWLENLAAVHGVTVGDRWGLDWSVPLVRPDAISPALTAKFWRVAALLEDDAARDFASAQLSLLRTNRNFPTLVTHARPDLALESGQGFPLQPRRDRKAWPTTLAPFAPLFNTPWDFSEQHSLATVQELPRLERSLRDSTVWLWSAGLFYAAVVGFTFFWWIMRYWRKRHRATATAALVSGELVPEAVMLRAEERWAKRVLGVRTPAGAEKTRFSNATVEVNFHMQLRAIYKLVLEWRRRENNWEESDERLVEGATDAWLNGLDEFASLIGIYMRWVIKAGMKDGFPKADPLTEHEDSNHIWSRLLMYLSEHYWGMTTALAQYDNAVTPSARTEASREIGVLLNDLGLRKRAESFDARDVFNVPANPNAFDLLLLQKPGMTLTRIVDELEMKLQIPVRHCVRLVTKFKEFKRREHLDPLHPYLIEAAKLLPHFLLMGLGALIWYNEHTIHDEPLLVYVWEQLILPAVQHPLSWAVAGWAVPLLLGAAASVYGHWVTTYRWQASMQTRAQPEVWVYQTMTSFFTRTTELLPKTRAQWWWNPLWFERAGWALRAVGFLGLGLVLLRLETPNFVTFLLVKGILAQLAFVEVGAIVLPTAITLLSKFLQDWVASHPNTNGAVKFFHALNLTATRPTSVLWQSLRYHFEPTAPSGDNAGILQTIAFYFLQTGVFFVVGVYLCQEMLPLWFTEKYLAESDWKLFFGGLIFWNTMYLLRYGLFLLATGVSSFLATFPLRTLGATLALAQLTAAFLGGSAGIGEAGTGALALAHVAVFLLGLALLLFEEPLLAWLRRAGPLGARARRRAAATAQKLERVKQDQSATLGILYMSGDDLCHLKLTPELLMTRWRILRDKLDSESIRWLFDQAGRPADAELEARFKTLYEAEKKSDVTLWHPSQLCVVGGSPAFAPELGLNLWVADAAQRSHLLQAWHARRWLVTMMSTAGHSQDTAINLVDIALRLQREGLAANTAFYLIQNKYDNNDTNRPSQLPYDRGELGHRNKLARLLCAVAPGARAYSLQNWTPFGFKAGGLTGMDLAYEESMRLSTILILDRNATVNDLDSLMTDLTCALTDPGVVIVIPRRGTTNTLTPLGQASQLVEEGHRSFAQGLMACMGGTGSEAVGTGWGNILAVFYGRVQRAMVDTNTPKRPLTSRMRRGSSMGVRLEGLIGFSPHAVGISEDTWSVSQTAHNAIALGHRVKFLLSTAMWHKIRETWSHAEWLSAFPRWSGGFVQMMHDPIMQQINDFGPLSVFAKEIRANSGRYFLTALFALASILLMPFAIILDFAPFVQILIVLWNFGFIMNQVLTLHGLEMYLEGAGFHRAPALLGALGTGLLCAAVPGLRPFTPGLVVLGLLGGGFLVGFSRWLYYRLRDVILFGPQLILHALGQLMRQSLEFMASGASPEDAKGVNMAFRTWSGPREDRPHEKFPSLFNFRTVVWLFGGTSLAVHLIALGSLDMFNVLLLLPSLLFSVSTFLGPFVTKPKAGPALGWRVVLPKALAWGGCFALYTIVSWLVARGGELKAIGVTLLTGLFGFLLTRALRYLGFHGKLQRLRRALLRQLVTAGVAEADARTLARLVLEQNPNAPAKMQAALTPNGTALPGADSIMQFAENTIRPLLRTPLTDLTEGRFANNRFASEFSASFVLALFTLGLFYVVPLPGLFVLAAHDYHISLSLGTVLRLVGWVIALAIVGLWAGRLVEWLERTGLRGGLRRRTAAAHRSFQSLGQEARTLTPQEISSVYALFTDVQTYLDQRSYGYARRTLGHIETVLAAARGR